MPQPLTHEREFRIRHYECDACGHVNNAVYLAYLEEASFAVAEAFGWPLRRMMDAGFAIVARHYHIEYKQPA
ncbi:MAG: acyl-CoA thioesterase [Chloroflexi bacterium]|nr:acyl-CoA thioesterase [Chloroflexota bacterium]